MQVKIDLCGRFAYSYAYETYPSIHGGIVSGCAGSAAVPGAGSEAVLPTEESEPPFEVGQLANQAGYTVDLEEGMQLNFRMVGTQLRVYWLDADGLVVEPLSTAGTIRFRKAFAGRSFFNSGR